MTTIAMLVAAASTLLAAPSISGRVVDGAGAPVAGARVFLECGLGSTLVETRADGSGAFHFDNPALGVAGVLAIAEGRSFGGATVTVSVEDVINDVVVVLRAPQTLAGKVVDPKGKPVEGARVTRALILGEQKVGMPLAKLRSLGFTEPVSDAEGRFTVPLLPEGGSAALKIAHPEFAQASVTDVAVGSADVRITMNPGVLVRGQAVSRDQHVPVANAQIILTRAVAPFDTVLARTGATGDFAVRLEPGPYVAQAAGAEFRSPAGEKLNITGEAPEVKLKLAVAGTGAIHGTVSDAATGKPIDGAKIVVSANGSTAAHVFTGPTGEFRVDAAEGESIVTLDSAPGYLAPAKPAMKVSVVQGQEASLPTFWLAPIPSYSVQVVDGDMKPVAGAVVTLLRPAQFGWRVTDADGRTSLSFAALPPDGVVVGLAEHVSQPLGALFALDRAKAKDAKVQLLPLGRAEGNVTGRGGKKLPGAVVGALFTEAPFTDTVLLWQTLAREDGGFAWDSVVPLAPLKCVAKAAARKSGEEKVGESAAFTIEPAGAQAVGRIVVDEGAPAESVYGKTLKWRQNRRLAGPAPAEGVPAVLLYCTAADAPAVAEGLGVAQGLFGARVAFVAVVNGPYSSPDAAVPVLEGSAPGAATTYLVGADDKVRLETFGMPPLRALQQVIAGH